MAQPFRTKLGDVVVVVALADLAAVEVSPRTTYHRLSHEFHYRARLTAYLFR
jgi:hypothetical protein